ncbi:LysM peptidoglycan-binding domain-containing protein [Lacunimicrobium album]
MQPETKIGLALGMILFGFFLAIGVRLTAEPSAPSLRHPEVVEDQMSKHPLPLAPIAAAKSDAVVPVVDFGKSSLIYQGDQFAPNPISTVKETEVAKAGVGGPADTIATKATMTDRDVDVVYHVVGSGETLSSIAGKHLGSTAKFREIYELNKDQLSSPDSLQVGMKLLVKGKPQRTEPAVEVIEQVADVKKEETTKASPERVVSVDKDEKKVANPASRFSPAKSSPFTRKSRP